jgi:hypothetical protein
LRRPYFNGFGDCLPRYSLKVDVFEREMDGYHDKGPDSQYFDLMTWVIAGDPDPLSEITIVTFGIYS